MRDGAGVGEAVGSCVGEEVGSLVGTGTGNDEGDGVGAGTGVIVGVIEADAPSSASESSTAAAVTLYGIGPSVIEPSTCVSANGSAAPRSSSSGSDATATSRLPATVAVSPHARS